MCAFIYSCLLILSTLFASTSNSLPSTTVITFLEIWMIFAVIFTFAVTILQTAYGYYKGMGGKSNLWIWKIILKKFKRNKNFCFKISYIWLETYQKEQEKNLISSLKEEPKKPASKMLNEVIGRKFFPGIFLMCSMLYTGIAIWIYNMHPRDFHSQEKC